MAPAPFVVIEGLDGSGKSTVAMEVAGHLGAELLATPSTCLTEARRILEPAYEGYPLARMLWYASTVAAASQDAERLVRSGRPVVMARYWLSTLVYAEIRGARCALEEVGVHILVPDLTAYLYARPDVRAARMGGRADNTTEDARTLEPDWERAIDAGYRARATHRVAGRFLPIDVSDISPETAAAHIVSALEGVNARR